jgi:hypothetical protein
MAGTPKDFKVLAFFFKKNTKSTNPRNREKSGKWPGKTGKILGLETSRFLFEN